MQALQYRIRHICHGCRVKEKDTEYQEFVDQYKDKEMPQEEMQKAQLILQTNVERSREIKEQHPLTLKPWER